MVLENPKKWKKRREDVAFKVTLLSIGQLRVMITKALSKDWNEILQNPTIMIRAFEKTGLSLPLDGSLDSKKMHFQGCDVGIPPGMVIAPQDAEEPAEELLMAG